MTITLPYLQALQRSLPDTEIDFLTREESGDIPAHLDLFQRVYALGGARIEKRQIAQVLWQLPRLRRRRYDAVLDLQNNRVSRVVRWLLRPRAWSAFDRFSPVSAGERTRRTIEAAGFPMRCVRPGLTLKEPDCGRDILREHGWTPENDLIILSPAGCFPTRNWPLGNYAAFARQWLTQHPVQFAVLGLSSMRPKADFLREEVGPALLNLVGKTTASQALGVVQQARLILTEDCGLMHMAWVSGTPTLALFGSSPHVWSGPLGNYSRCLHSGDLVCGPCLRSDCRYSDVHCLSRYTPPFIVEQAQALLATVRDSERIIFDEGRP